MGLTSLTRFYFIFNIIGIIIGLLPVNSITYELISKMTLFFRSVKLKLSFSSSFKTIIKTC